MTDRINVLTVGLEVDYRDDDIDDIINAILMIKGVLNVTTNISNVSDWIAEERAKQDMKMKLVGILR